MAKECYIKLNGVEYPAACTLRVAYVIQGQHNHKPYTEIFKSLGEMTIEDQIDVIFAAFSVLNPEISSSSGEFSRINFRNYYLDNVDLSELMAQLQNIVEGILGTNLVSGDANETSNDQGNSQAQ